MTKDEWIQKCAARYQERGGLERDEALEAAHECYASLLDFNIELPENDTNPVCEADEDMSYWTDDEATP